MILMCTFKDEHRRPICDGSGDTLTCGNCGDYYCTCCGCKCSLWEDDDCEFD